MAQKEHKINILLDLFLTFAKIGLFTFGGGYAMISVIDYNCVEKKKWITSDDMMNITVIAESTPGPIALNCSTFVGYKQRGLAGAVAATIGMIVPSFVIIYIISLFLDNFLEITLIAKAFKGIKLAVGVLIVEAAVTMIRKMKKKLMPRLFLICGCAAMLAINIFSLRISSIILILAAGVVGLTVFICKNAKKGGAAK